MFKPIDYNGIKTHTTTIIVIVILLRTQVRAAKVINQNKTTPNDLSYLKNYFNHHHHLVTEFNFLQSRILGNCGMIAAMATLAISKKTYKKVVLEVQNFVFNPHQCLNSDSPVLFTFDLYKQEKMKKFVIDESLPIKGDFIYSNSVNWNFVGPLLEKASCILAGNTSWRKG